jgi:altronate hydrolase
MKQAFLKALGYAQPDLYLDQVSTLLDAYQSGADIDSLKTFTFQQKKSDYRHNRVFKNVDGIKFLTHESGCGENREDSENLCNLLAGYCVNPNVAGITVLSLGCQHSQVSILQEAIHKISPNFEKPLYILEQQQDLGSGESQMLAEAIRQTFVGMIQINEIERQPAPLSKLRVGVKCGGSDGFSGISANPAIGHTADLLVALGANVMIAEFPEFVELNKNCKTVR